MDLDHIADFLEEVARKAHEDKLASPDERLSLEVYGERYAKELREHYCGGSEW